MKREKPTIKTKYFNVFGSTKEECAQWAKDPRVMTIDNGEQAYESRGYLSLDSKSILTILAKTREDGMIFAIIKFKYRNKRKERGAFVPKGWIEKEKYEQLVKALEEGMATECDTVHPIIIPGRHINLYLGNNTLS